MYISGFCLGYDVLHMQPMCDEILLLAVTFNPGEQDICYMKGGFSYAAKGVLSLQLSKISLMFAIKTDCSFLELLPIDDTTCHFCK